MEQQDQLASHHGPPELQGPSAWWEMPGSEHPCPVPSEAPGLYWEHWDHPPAAWERGTSWAGRGGSSSAPVSPRSPSPAASSPS